MLGRVILAIAALLIGAAALLCVAPSPPTEKWDVCTGPICPVLVGFELDDPDPRKGCPIEKTLMVSSKVLAIDWDGAKTAPNVVWMRRPSDDETSYETQRMTTSIEIIWKNKGEGDILDKKAYEIAKQSSWSELATPKPQSLDTWWSYNVVVHKESCPVVHLDPKLIFKDDVAPISTITCQLALAAAVLAALGLLAHYLRARRSGAEG